MTSKASAAAKACLETLLKLSLWNFSCLYRLPLAIHSSVWILISCSHPRHPSCIIGLLYFSHLILSKPTDSENTYVNGMLVFVIAEGDFFWNGHCFVWRIHLSATVPGSFQPTSRTQQLMRRLLGESLFRPLETACYLSVWEKVLVTVIIFTADTTWWMI